MTVTLQAVNELIASLESAGELSIREQKFLKLAKAYQQLAAENVGLKDCIVKHYPAVEHWNSWADAEDKIQSALDTPATDRIVAEAEAQGAEAYETALLTSDDDDFTYEVSICVEETHQQREEAK